MGVGSGRIGASEIAIREQIKTFDTVRDE